MTIEPKMTTYSSPIDVEISMIPFADVPALSAKDKAYAASDSALCPFYKYEVTLENFQKIIEDKKRENTNREVLINTLLEQYASMKAFPNVEKNIRALSSNNTFTIITAHQPSLFTGPLYYIYKIISTINLTKKLNTQFPDYQFVPVFVTGGEDHDFEEMNHINLFNKKLVWENEESGSVGAMQTSTLKKVLAALKEILGNSENASAIYSLMERVHTENKQYSDAALALVNELFGNDGLVVLNMNRAALKRLFIPIMKEELLSQVSQKLVHSEIEKLNVAGFKTQAAPREINLFYLHHQIRERIVFEPADQHGGNDRYQVLNTNISFSEGELLEELENHPEHFSPNVVMRPLFQELIFPNLAYIGGGGELAYWMERQSQFEHFGINFPMLIRRNSALWIDKGTQKKMAKLGLSVEDIFLETEELIKLFVKRNAENPLNFQKEKNDLRAIFEGVKNKTIQVDPTLGKTVAAEAAKQIKSLENLEARVHKAEKQKHEVALNQIRALKEKLFPSNGLQERKDNFMSFYLRHGTSYFETLKANFDVLDKRFLIIKE